MRNKHLKFNILLFIVIVVSGAQAQTIDYLGQPPPGNTAVIFAPDIISLTNRGEINITFSPDGNEIYIEVNDGIYYMKRVNAAWTEQVKEPIFNGFNLPVFSANKNKIYLTNYRTSEIWVAERTTEGWNTPHNLPSPVNIASSDDYSPSETTDSIIYFQSNRIGGIGGTDIWCKRPSSDQAENLGTIVNSASNDYSPCIAPDGSYLIFSSNRKGGFSEDGNDFYVSFNKGNNEWTAPVNMEISAAKINIPKNRHICPSLSPDGKYLFFNRHSYTLNLGPDIYWVSTSIIDDIKKTAFPTGINNNDKTIILHNIFPNPTKDKFSISFGTTPVKKAIADIYNSAGKLIFSKSCYNEKIATINLTGYPAGIYWVKVIIDRKNYNAKITKE